MTTRTGWATALAAGFVTAVGWAGSAGACGMSWPTRGPARPSTFNKARAALAQGRLKEALSLFRKEGARDWVARTRFELGLVALRASRPAEAIRELQAALRENPTHVGASAELVEALRSNRQAALALDTAAGFPAGIAAEPMVRAARARALADLGRRDEARALFTALAAEGRLPTRDRAFAASLGTRFAPPRLGDI